MIIRPLDFLCPGDHSTTETDRTKHFPSLLSVKVEWHPECQTQQCEVPLLILALEAVWGTAHA